MAVVFVLLRESGVWEAARNNHKPNGRIKVVQMAQNVSSVTAEALAWKKNYPCLSW